MVLLGAAGRRSNKLRGRYTALVGLFKSLTLQSLSLSPAATLRQFEIQGTTAFLCAAKSSVAGGTQTVRDSFLTMG